jgi:mono/diheme cytochrome c family protein
MHIRSMVSALGAAIVSFAPLAVAQTGVPTYSKDVAPIIYKNCASCHRPDDIGPMPLLTYEQTRPWAASIREKVSAGLMPPWHSTDPHGTFSNDRRLSDADRETLIRWASNGAPQGNPKDLPPAPKFTEGWEIGQPDLVLAMDKPFSVPDKGTVNYQYFTIKTNFTEDKWIQAIEVRPGVRKVVHHILVFVREPGGAPPKPAFMPVDIRSPGDAPASDKPHTPQQGFGNGTGTLIATTAPGTNAMTFAPGSAVRIKAGSTLLLQVHYTANGTAATDLSSVGFIFAKAEPKQEVHNSAFVNAALKLPPGADNQEVDSAIQFNENSHITALFPHTHLRGKSWEYRIVYPDGSSKVVLSVPHYDFNWQTYYIFTKPLAVPKGSRIEAVAHYDNSANNKFNPDPTVEVHWGEQTWQEMQYTGITYTVDEPLMTGAIEKK